MEIKKLTKKEYEKVVAAGQEAIKDIPVDHNRKLAHAQAEAEIKALHKIIDKKRALKPEEIVGKKVELVKLETRNIGSSTKWSDYVTEVTTAGRRMIYKITDSRIVVDNYYGGKKTMGNVLAVIF